MNSIKEKFNRILSLMDNIKYGFTDTKSNVYETTSDNYRNVFPTLYKLKINDELLKEKYGVCWDQVELERFYLENEHIECQSYGIICYDTDMDPTHTFIVVEDNDKWYWLEHAWHKYEGIHEYRELRELLLDVKKKFKIMLIDSGIDSDNIFVYRYNKPLNNLDCMEFYHHMESGQLIKLNNKEYYYTDNLEYSNGYLELFKEKKKYKININDEEIQKTIKDIIDDKTIKICFLDNIDYKVFFEDGDKNER